MTSDFHSDGVAFQIEEKSPTRAVVLHIDVKSKRKTDDDGRSLNAALDEIVGLALAIELDIVAKTIISVAKITAATLLGRGKVAQISEMITDLDAELVVVNNPLTPGQQRNLERQWQAKVVDRTGLILEIFGRRASTREGRLQVELAHLKYQKSRLVRSWTHLERQRGGAGFLGGPGETQIEADRRVLQDKISKIEKQLAQVVRTRQLHRAGRAKVPFPIIALAGYTNAGKSTLFNQLTQADVVAENLLFATLDPTMRQVELPHGRKIILSDTVGFVSDLPTTLVAAFRATLEEVLEADIIVHIRDISHADSAQQAQDVIEVLTELGVEEAKRVAMIEVWNKIDLVNNPEDKAALKHRAERQSGFLTASALTGEGVNDLLITIEQALADMCAVFMVEFHPRDGAEIAWAHAHGEVLARDNHDDGRAVLQVRLDARHAGLAKQRWQDRIKQVN